VLLSLKYLETLGDSTISSLFLQQGFALFAGFRYQMKEIKNEVWNI